MGTVPTFHCYRCRARVVGWERWRRHVKKCKDDLDAATDAFADYQKNGGVTLDLVARFETDHL